MHLIGLLQREPLTVFQTAGTMLFTIEAINQLDQHRFIESIGWVFEQSPWVAERAWHHRPFKTLTELWENMNEEVDAALVEEQLGLLRAHPDLGTRATIAPAPLLSKQAPGSIN